MNKKFKHKVNCLIDMSYSKNRWKRLDEITNWANKEIGRNFFDWGLAGFTFDSLQEFIFGFTSKRSLLKFTENYYQEMYKLRVYLNLDQFEDRVNWGIQTFGKQNRDIHSKKARWNSCPRPGKFKQGGHSDWVEFRFRHKEDYTHYMLTWGYDDADIEN